MSGSITATGQIIAQTLNVQQVTSSIVYSSGSNIFGNSLANTQIMTGSVSITGSLSVNGVSSTVGSGTSNFISKFTSVNSLGNSLIFDNGTNIGIGTQTPNYLVSIRGNSNSGIFLKQGGQIADSPTTASFYNGLTFENSSTTNAWSIGYSQGAAFSINYFDTNLTYRYLTISTSGNVGIRTINPISMLTVDNGLNGNITAGFMMNMGSTSQGASAYGMVGINVYGGTGNSIYALRTGYQPQFIEFAWNDAMIFHATSNTFTAGVAITGTEKMRITNSGNVLIGTTTGHYVTTNRTVLNVNGTSSAIIGLQAGNTTSGYLYVDANDFTVSTEGTRNLNLTTAGNAPIVFITNTTEKMRITSDGNVGIGTTSPNNRLQVDVSSNTTTLYNDSSYPLRINNTSTTNNSYVGMYFGTGLGVGVTIQALYANASTRTEGSLLFSTRDSGGSLAERMRINGSGDVGIGIIDPASYSARLTVNGNIRAASGNSVGVWDPSNTTYVQMSSPSNRVVRWTNDAGTEYMRITSGGNVGIGTTTPSGRLHLTGTYDGAQNTLNLENNWPNTHRTSLINFWAYYNSTNPQAVIEAGQDVSATNAGVIEFKTMLAGAAPATRMIIKPDGNVGIGTTSPSYRLHVVGTEAALDTSSAMRFYINRTGTNVGSIIFTTGGPGTGNGWAEIGQTDANGDLFFKANPSAGGFTNRMIIRGATGHIVPGANGTQNLGSDTERWATVFTSDLDMSNGIGDYTIVEGEEDLFLYNNKTNKVFKFLIQEVDPSTAPPKKIKN